MNYPKFLPIKREKKGTLNMRINEELLEELTNYSILTDSTVTDVVTDLIRDFMKDKVTTNDCLKCGITFNIPTSEEAKNYFIDKQRDLKSLNDRTIIDVGSYSKRVPISTLEVMNIPNNLDIFINGTFQSEDENELHHGIDFYIYPDLILHELRDFNEKEYLNNLYCFYFEVGYENDISVYLIHYLEAINLLEGYDDVTKLNLIGAVESLRRISYNLFEGYKKYLESNEEDDEKFSSVIDKQEKHLERICRKYNKGNIVSLGTDIEKRVLKNSFDSDDELDERIDLLKELLEENKKVIETINSLNEKKNSISKLEKILEYLEEENPDLNDKINK